MTTLTAEFILQVLIALASGGSVYAAIRADLATLHERTSSASKSIERAHQRLDEHIDQHQIGRV